MRRIMIWIRWKLDLIFRRNKWKYIPDLRDSVAPNLEEIKDVVGMDKETYAFIKQQVVHEQCPKGTVLLMCSRCKGTGKTFLWPDEESRALCPNCHGTGMTIMFGIREGKNEEI